MIERQLSVYSKQEYVRFDLCLPDDKIGDFILFFGQSFKESSVDAGMVRRMVDRIYHQGGYHIVVSLRAGEVEQFEEFMKDFCKANSLEFRGF